MQLYQLKRKSCTINNEYDDLCKSLTEVTSKINKAVKNYLYQNDRRVLNKYMVYLFRHKEKFKNIHEKLIGILESNGYTENEIQTINKKMNKFIRHVDILIAQDKPEERIDQVYKYPKILKNLDAYSYGVIFAAAVIKLSTALRQNLARVNN